MISINEVSYSYHRSEEEQIKRISMETDKGEIILLCGRSGSGDNDIMMIVQ